MYGKNETDKCEIYSICNIYLCVLHIMSVVCICIDIFLLESTSSVYLLKNVYPLFIYVVKVIGKKMLKQPQFFFKVFDCFVKIVCGKKIIEKCVLSDTFHVKSLKKIPCGVIRKLM